MNTKIFAFAGKGGVGKTSLSAAFVRILSQMKPDKKILAIDADPAVGLATALNAEAPQTLDDVRKKIAQSIDMGQTAQAIELLREAEFHLTDCITEKDNISFLAIGRPEGAGCYCKVNAYLKQVIETVSQSYDYVVIDGEAGIEQINRRVMQNITYLVLVTDGSKKGIGVVSTVKKVADELSDYKEAGIIFNRVPGGFTPDEKALPCKVLSVIGVDEQQTQNDIEGQSVFSLSQASALYIGARQALKNLLQEDG